jgi:hypothetical protein
MVREYTKGVKFLESIAKRSPLKRTPPACNKRNDTLLAEPLPELKLTKPDASSATVVLSRFLLGKELESVSEVREHLRSLDVLARHSLIPSDLGVKKKAISHQVLEKLHVDGRYSRFWRWIPRRIYDLLPGLYR